MTGVCEAFQTQKTRLTRDTWHKELAADRKASFTEVVGSFKKAIFEGTKEVSTDVKTEVRVSPKGAPRPFSSSSTGNYAAQGSGHRAKARECTAATILGEDRKGGGPKIG